MEQKFGKNSIDIKALREFCEREGKMVEYRKGEQLEREGDPARWFGFVVTDAISYILEAPLGDEAEPPCGVALALQLFALAVSDFLTLPFAEQIGAHV